MFAPIADLSKARILISNDDGIDAPGIKILEKIARSLSKDVWVVAPASEQSAAGHSLTLRRPLRLRKHGRQRYSVDGTPTDSVLLAVNLLLKDKKPTLMLSGVNRGANLGDDVTYSGTVAAAMEATLLGVPAIALSQEHGASKSIHWKTTERFAAKVIRKACSVGWPRNVLINVNFPDCVAAEVKGVAAARQGARKIGDQIIERVDPRGEDYVWIGAQRNQKTESAAPGTDIDAVLRKNMVAVTPLSVDLTHRETLRALRKAFA